MQKFLITTFLFWRLGLFLTAWLGGKILSFLPSFPYSDIYLISSRLPQWLWPFANFDGVHYLTIAKYGYSAQFTQVFFPLYPVLINIINRIVPFINPVLVGLILSNFFFLFSLFIFWKLLSLDYKCQDISWILLFFIIFPTAFFFVSLYTESLFLFLILASFYAARIKKWWLAGLLGGLASATRLVGIVLLPALLWEWWQEKVKSPFGPRSSGRGQKSLAYPPGQAKVKTATKNLKLSTALSILHSPVLYLVPLGLIAYMVYLQLNFDDWLYFWHVQPVFGAERSGSGFVLLPQVIWRYLKILFTTSFYHYNFWVAVWELGSVVIGCGLWVVGLLKKIRVSYMIFSFFAIIIPTLTGTFSSMPRYILVAFPMFIVLGLIKNKPLKITLSVTCYLLSAIFTILFTSGRWVS